ncbi:uncharacterized protein LOC124451274 isoform X2 [Xenia sp. Carnegie-2017]|uniref:uncharacterized protein LOC124451274 isoform X2 n=1 Tax=Xenia sp. Carnegie-2017 TaxID=2897299 RepID=UPI001F049992|nr:uncharacterized protein LOC124451274 isoform X2 [Xenia sp. Carnegie-2017]
MDNNQEPVSDAIFNLDMAWSDCIFSLKDFIELYPLPQMVQVSDGWYGEGEEAIELSQGDVLILHLYKETPCFTASTEYGKEVNIPLNLSKKVYVYYEKSLKDVKSLERLGELFPHKYSSVRLQRDLKNCLDKKDIYRAGDTLQVMRFDVSRKQLVCLNKKNFYVRFSMSQISHLTVTDVTIDSFVLADVHHQFKLPLTVRFVQYNKLPGLIHFKEIVSRKTVVASLGNKEYESLLTFPSTLNITVCPPTLNILHHPEYQKHVHGVSKEVHVESVHEELKDSEMYETIEELNTKAVPYSVFHFKKPNQTVTSSNIEKHKDGHEPKQREDTEGTYETMSYKPFLSARTRQNHYVEDPFSQSKDACELILPSVNVKSLITSIENKNVAPNGQVKSAVNDQETSHTTNLSKSTSKSLPSNISESREDRKCPSPTGPRRQSPFSCKKDRFSTKTSSNKEKFPNENVKSSNEEINDRPCRSASPKYHDKRNDENVKETGGYKNEKVLGRQSESEEIDSDGYQIPKVEGRNKPLFTVNDVCNLLKDINLSQYCDLFKKEQVDGNILRDMDEEMLKSHFKMSAFHVLKLQKAVNENWRPEPKES